MRARLLPCLLGLVGLPCLLPAPTACRSQSTTAGDAGATPAASTAPVAPFPLRLWSERLKGGEVSVLMENVSEAPLELETELVIERRGEAGTWEEIFTSGLKIRPSCDAPAAACVTLSPHMVLRAPPWLGMEGDAQCACRECATAKPGRYRFVARRCDRTAHLEGEPFDYVR